MYSSISRPTIMAICTDSSRCGGAIYADSIIQMLADRKDKGDPYKGLDIIIQKFQPEIVIVSSVQQKLIDFIEKRFQFDLIDISKRNPKSSRFSESNADFNSDIAMIHDQEEISDNQLVSSDINFKLIVVPNIWFSMSRGIQKLIDSELVKSKGLKDQEEKSLFITSKVEKSADVCALRSISALDNYIAHAFALPPEPELQVLASPQSSDLNVVNTPRQEQSDQLDIPNLNLMPILDIKYVDPGPVLSIDNFTLETLGIIHKQLHSHSDFNELNEQQDSQLVPSLYDVLNRCFSQQGKRHLRTMMMWPLQDIDEITRRYDAIDYFMDPANTLFRDQLSIHIKNVVPLAPVVAKLNLAIGTYREFSTLYKALWAFVAIIDIIRANTHNLSILDRIVELDSSPLRTVVDSIMNIVDFEASKREKRIQICIGVDQVVDDKKEIVKNLTKFCDEVAIQETAKYKATLKKLCRVVYVPRIGFLNSVEYSSTSELMAIRTSKEFDVLLYTEQSVYFKTERMEQLDNNAGDIACDLIDVQESVIVELQDKLLEHTNAILKLMELCGELDCLIAFSIVSLQRGFTRPEFTTSDDEIDIKQAYHPLHSTKSNMIPNDTHFYKESSGRRVKVMIITGPNSCGKTTYMKATCLVVYMAHIGCFVPALSARMPIVDAILTRMHSASSISTGLSSFATDIHQINYALRKATGRSLIAIDEFGKGTLASDGFHLLKGLIIYFATRTQEGPYVLVSTHFSRLINYLQSYSEHILYKTFKVTRDPLRDSIIYEFQLMDGVGDISLADKVAAIAGVPQSIIERASQVRDYITAGLPIRPLPPHGA